MTNRYTIAYLLFLVAALCFVGGLLYSFLHSSLGGIG